MTDKREDIKFTPEEQAAINEVARTILRRGNTRSYKEAKARYYELLWALEDEIKDRCRDEQA